MRTKGNYYNYANFFLLLYSVFRRVSLICLAKNALFSAEI